jgi:hypothetical protein
MEPVPVPVQTILDLFINLLGDVRFADVDAKTLEQFATDVRSAADVVASAELALDAARAVLQEKQDGLLQYAQRALAYARVYAENDEALSARLEAITLPRVSRRPRTGVDALVLSGTAGGRPGSGPELTPRVRKRRRNASGAEPLLDSDPLLNGVEFTAE